MTNDDADGGVHESVAAHMRAAAVVAMQVGERLAKAWTELARDAEHRATAETSRLAARIKAERSAAVAALTVVERPEWWEHATGTDVAGMIETAATWTDRDPAVARAMATIEREVQDRYGHTAEALHQRTRAGDDRAEAIEAVTAAGALDRVAAAHPTRTMAGEEHLERGEEPSTRRVHEQGLAAADSSAVIAVRGRADSAYDSAERRESFAAALEGSAEPDEIAGRVRSDVNFAHPAQSATVTRGVSSSRGRAAQPRDRPRQGPTRTR